MKNKTPFPMTPFDMLVVPEHLHIMKLFLPFRHSENSGCLDQIYGAS